MMRAPRFGPGRPFFSAPTPTPVHPQLVEGWAPARAVSRVEGRASTRSARTGVGLCRGVPLLPRLAGEIVELLHRGIEIAVAFCVAKATNALDQNLLRRRLLAEQPHHLVGEIVKRLVHRALFLPRRQRRLHARRCQFDDLHLAVQRVAQRQRVAVDRRFGRAIGRRIDQRHEGKPGGDGDDHRIVLALQVVDQRVGQADRPQQVGRYRLFGIRQVALRFQRLEAHDAGIVDQHVEVGMRLDHTLGEVGHTLRAVDVDGHRVDSVAPVRDLVQRLLPAACDDDGIARIVPALC
ncbi:hypothetical protein WR25_09166 [Diploscapter pachys]|uniref:Uncharacterized protein n=1 Tax=Diploscapter pachys TaxID=2018661 RepID=A0A2A2JY82_9BILA|nr:hypothetical protein WR25_09166 [Diploscapter pachys]